MSKENDSDIRSHQTEDNGYYRLVFPEDLPHNRRREEFWEHGEKAVLALVYAGIASKFSHIEAGCLLAVEAARQIYLTRRTYRLYRKENELYHRRFDREE